jgi:ribosomal protein L16 Arg81 hydroxylase
MSLIYTALSINAIRADKIREIYTTKLVHSSQFVSAWYSESMVTNTTSIRSHTIQIANEQRPAEKAKLIRELVDNQELYVNARTILNFLEHMAQDISFKLGDEEYLRTFFNHIVHTYYHTFTTVIAKARQDERSLVPFCEVEALATKWR